MTKPKMDTNNVLVIGDTHEYFTLPNYREFCKEVEMQYRCGTVIHIGDLVDHHSINFHEHNPNGLSPADEIKKTTQHISKWAKAFPNMTLLLGNHDQMIARKIKAVGLPAVVVKSLQEIYGMPATWNVVHEYQLFGIRFIHGTGYSGAYPHVSALTKSRQSVVLGHVHSVAGIAYSASPLDCIFGMAVGSGADRDTYAFQYADNMDKKPIISCGVITDRKNPQIITMDLGSKIKITV